VVRIIYSSVCVVAVANQISLKLMSPGLKSSTGNGNEKYLPS